MKRYRLFRYGRIRTGPAYLLLAIVPSVASLPAPALAAAGHGGFLENVGQLDESVRFSTTVSGMTLFFTRDALVIDLQGPAGEKRGEQLAADPVGLLDSSRLISPSPRPGHVTRIRFRGANPATDVSGEDLLPGAFNFLQGADPAAWYTGVRRYAQVTYHELWTGIDLVFRLTPRGLEYDVRASSGADPSRVRFAYEGADHIQTSASADRIETSVGELIHRLPVTGGRGGLISRGDAGASMPLGGDCDAFFDWATFLGGSGEDWGSTIVLDSSGRAVVTGQTLSTDFPTKTGAYAESSAGDWDSFVTKLDETGSDLVWSTYIGGELLDWALALALDASDNPVIAGITRSADYPTTPAAYDTTASAPAGDLDVFVTKLSNGGDSLLWSTYLGGELDRDEQARGIVLDDTGNILVGGLTYSGDFPTTAGAYRTSHPDGERDAYVTKLASDGGSLVWSTLLGSDEGGSGEFIMEITLDAGENPVVGGLTGSVGFPTTPGAFDSTYAGGNDAFLTKLAADGSDVEWSTLLGGAGAERIEDLEIDPATGDVFAFARTVNSPTFPTTPGVFDETYNGMFDAAVLRMSADGSTLHWSTFLGGSEDDWAGGLALGPSYLVVAGRTSSTNFPTTDDAFEPTYNGGAEDGFITVLRQTDGGALLWSTFVGGSTDDGAPFPAEGFSDDAGGPLVVSGDEAYFVGLTGANDFPACPSGSTWDETFGGVLDAVVLKLTLSHVVVGVSDPEVVTHSLLRVAPNPFRSGITITFELPVAGTARVTVHDVAGRLVRVLDVPEGLSAGTHRVIWDGRNGSGTTVEPGVYFARLEAGDRWSVTRFVRIE